MTVTSTSREAGPFPGDGVTTVLPFSFKVFAAGDLLVERVTTSGRTVLALTTDYTVSLNSDQDTAPGGAVTLTAANAVGSDVYITSDVEETQERELVSQGGFFPRVVNNALDKLTILIQQLRRTTGQSLRVSAGSELAPLPPTKGNFGKYVALDASGNPTYASGTGADSALRTDLAGASGSSLVGFNQPESGSVPRSQRDKLREFKTVTDYGSVLADGSNQSTNIISALTNAFTAADRETVIIPPNVRWNPQTVLSDANVQALERLAIFDLGGMNASTKAGENTKIIGVFGIDPDATEDTYLGSASSHHAVVCLNNLGIANTASAEQAFMSLLYARGYFTDGTDDNKTFKGAMIAQYRRSQLDTTQWEHCWRSLAPFEALADGAKYTRWYATTVYAVGDFVVTDGDRIYKCTVAGTSGASYPTHTSGTATDGSVTWQYVDVNDRLVFSFDQQGRVKSNGASVATDLVAFRQATTDSASIAVFRITGTGTSKEVRWIAEPTDGAGAIIASPYFRWTPAGVLEFRDGGGSLYVSQEGVNKGLKVEMLRNAWDTAANGDTTPSVTNVATLYVNNTGATSITALDDGSDGQVVEIIAQNGNTTLVHSATLMLTGSANVTLTTYSSVTFRKVPTSISDRWVEIARSIK